MENPEIKALLKTAKDAIKTKDFNEALKICKVTIIYCGNFVLVVKIYGTARTNFQSINQFHRL